MSEGAPAEDELIQTFFAPLAGDGAFGLRDDAARLQLPAGEELVITKDMIVAGVHFFPDDAPASIARKALRVNLSDLAAKGARPLGFLLGLGLPKGTSRQWLAEFAAALGEDARVYACPLLGGDTVKTPGGVTISVTAFGSCPAGGMVRRGAGRPGLALAVTGTIGDAALGLALRQGHKVGWAAALGAPERLQLLDRYLHPQPRNVLAEPLRRHVTAAMDISDGLLGDAVKLARAAEGDGVACVPEIDLRLLPLSKPAAEALVHDPGLIETIATGGDDYELLLALEPDRVGALAREAEALGVPLTVIGRLTGDDTPRFIGRDGGGMTPAALKFEHGF